MEKRYENFINEFLESVKKRDVYLISHFDTDGISSAAIMIKTLKKLDIVFTANIVKNLDLDIINNIPKDKLILILDLASNSLDYISKSRLKEVFIIDHHEVTQEIPNNVKIINPQLDNKEIISSSGLTYLFCKELLKKHNQIDKELAKLAVLGMVGDSLEKNIDKLNTKIIDDNEIIKKRGLLLYPSTRPLNRVLEYSSNPYIPGVTGDTKGTLELLREAGINLNNGKFKSIIELNEEEMTRLVTAIILRAPKKREEIIGDIFLLKFYNKLEDAREFSAIVNACSRSGQPDIAIKLCLEMTDAKKKAESLHAKNRRLIISGLDFVSNSKKPYKIEGNGFVIINAKENIKETIIGTIASIISNSNLYEDGTIIITMSNYVENGAGKIKISARIVGKNGRNVRKILNDVIPNLGGEIGGHEHAAGGLIDIEKEEEFIELLKRNFELEVVKI